MRNKSEKLLLCQLIAFLNSLHTDLTVKQKFVLHILLYKFMCQPIRNTYFLWPCHNTGKDMTLIHYIMPTFIDSGRSTRAVLHLFVHI